MKTSALQQRLGAGFVVVLVAACLASGCSSSGSSSARPTTGGRTANGAVASGSTTGAVDQTLSVDGDKVTATVDPRFQSYNIEMVSVTGGKYWAPYGASQVQAVRAPIDLSSPKLRNLARALGPAYLRVSGTWANSTFFAPDGSPSTKAPAGFQGVLTGAEWKGVGAFATAVGDEILTSFASNTGARDAAGVWQPDQARSLMTFSLANDIPLTAAELVNEPSLGIGEPKGYDAADFARDFAIFTKLASTVMPKLKIVGPGATNDVNPLLVHNTFSATDMLRGIGHAVDAFSYHVYPKVSKRCGSTATIDDALKASYLGEIDAARTYYEQLRDTYEPGAPMWVTEIGEAACGGDPWAAQFVDVLRYVDTHGRLADGDGAVVFHNTLVGSDYGLLAENTYDPRPDYWAALLWHQLMGTKVLTMGAAGPTPDLAVYAHCTPKGTGPAPGGGGAASGGDGSVTYAVVNSSATAAHTVTTGSGKATVYQLTGTSLDSPNVSLNGTRLQAGADGTPPTIVGHAVTGAVTIPPASVAFLVDPSGAPACR